MQTFDRGTTREIEKHSKLERNIESNRLTEGAPVSGGTLPREGKPRGGGGRGEAVLRGGGNSVRGETTSGCGVWRRDSASEVGALNATRKKKKTGEETGRGKEAALRGRRTFGAKATVVD